MTAAAWDRLTDAIDIKFGITKHGHLDRAVADAPNLSESVQFIEFERDSKPLRLEYVTGPAIIDRKTIGAHRAGASVRFENVYDPTDTRTSVILLQDVSGTWEPLEIDALGL